MSSSPSKPDSPIPELDDWSGSEKGFANRPVETTRGAETYGSGSPTEGQVDPSHDGKDEAADNVKMGGTADGEKDRDSVIHGTCTKIMPI